MTIHSTAFETELTGRLGEKVDLDEIALDHGRYADPDMEEALVEYLQKHQARWQPDLVVPIGSPAGIFVEKYRERLFPQAPILYTGMDRRRLGPDALKKNAAFVGESFDLSGFVEDILQLRPDTTNIVCVIGASQVERYWAAAFQSEFARFTNRVGFTWVNDLPFDQMLERLKILPPRSFIFFILLMRDAAGVTRNADEALKQLTEVANAPVNSVYEEQLGLGIVGGRLYRAGFEGEESARLAVRILHGEAATNFPPEFVGPIGSQYDWRELRRWSISKDRLPPGSIVRYREPTPWERYRYLIFAAASVVLLQSALISGLLINLRQRKEAEAEAQRSRQELAHVNRVTTLGALAGSVAHELRQPLAAIVSSAEAAQRFLDGDVANDEEVREALTEISQQGRRAGEIITEMRAMLKKETVQTSGQDLNRVVTAVLEMMRSDLVARGVTPELRLAAALPPVNGDGVQLSQVVLNLVTNACDSMSKEPANRRKLTIESRRVEPNQVELSVADTGPGFPQEMLGDAFKAFHTTKAQGLGLGLAICQSIIMAHGGRLVAANNGNGGASVRLMLPARNGSGP